MNKKIAIIITLMITAILALMGCNSTVEANSESVSDAAVEASSSGNTVESNTDSTQDDTDKTEAYDSSVDNSNIESKDSQNNNSSQTLSNKTSIKDTSATTSSTETEDSTTKETNGKVTTFTAQAGYTLTFPANWDGKYIIEEKSDVLNVRYKSTKDKSFPNPLLFSIQIDNLEIDYDHFDSVGNIRFFNVGDTKYCIGGPTDIALSEESEDFNDFIDICRQKAEVVNSLKVIK